MKGGRTGESLRVGEIGAGKVSCADGEWRLSLPVADGDQYHDAQICDYVGRDFHNAPPMRLSLEARFDGEPRGTAGFGFWNHAFVPGERGLRLPQALWFFFGSPPNNMALAKGVAGHGWKAATFNARSWRFLALLPFAPAGFLLTRSQLMYNALWGIGQRALGVNERPLDSALMRDFHRYSIDWRADGAEFAVDGEVALRADSVARGRLGFIAWMDNQYAVVTPQGRFGHGTLDITRTQSLVIRDLRLSG